MDDVDLNSIICAPSFVWTTSAFLYCTIFFALFDKKMIFQLFCAIYFMVQADLVFVESYPGFPWDAFLTTLSSNEAE